MKISSSFLTCLLIMVFHDAMSCTTFFINKNGQLVFGRNYDWVSGAGMVCSNLAGLKKTSLKTEGASPVSWVSKYGSVTFNQYGKEFPTGGMNQQGLVVELMWADGSQYPAPDKRAALGVLQWIQYQLDNNATVQEVIETDLTIRISPGDPPLHYLVADANGDAATIEFFNGKMVVHKGKELPFPVLANSPYTQSEKAAADVNILSGNTRFSFQDNSLQRFTRACAMIQKYQRTDIQKPAVDYAFDILNEVAQKGFTKWSIVYDLKNKKIYFKTASFPHVKSFKLSSFDFMCTSTSKALDMNQVLRGDVDKNFKSFDNRLNRAIAGEAIEESRSRVPISSEKKESVLSYAEAIKCKD